MKIDISQKMKDINDKDIINPQNNQAMTLKSIAIEALLFPKEKDTEKEKYDKYDLYKKLKEVKKEVDLKVEEVAKIKKLIGEVKPPLIMGQAWDMLEKK